MRQKVRKWRLLFWIICLTRIAKKFVVLCFASLSSVQAPVPISLPWPLELILKALLWIVNEPQGKTNMKIYILLHVNHPPQQTFDIMLTSSSSQLVSHIFILIGFKYKYNCDFNENDGITWATLKTFKSIQMRKIFHCTFLHAFCLSAE